MLFSGAWGKMINEKTRSKKSVSLKRQCRDILWITLEIGKFTEVGKLFHRQRNFFLSDTLK